MKRKYYGLLAMLLLAACIRKDEPVPQLIADSRPVGMILQNNYALSMFSRAVTRAGLDSIANGKTLYTFLVPDNEAFTRSGITADSLEKINITELRKLISYHIITGKLEAADIPQTLNYSFKTFEGAPLYMSVPLPGQSPSVDPRKINVHVNGVKIEKANIPANNGVIHVLNRVLYYPAASVKTWLESTPSYSRFATGLKKFGLMDELDKKGPVAVLAIPNEVFDGMGIDDAAMEAIDTFQYRKVFFRSYILKSRLFFKSDFQYAMPGASGAFYPPVLILDDAILWYDYSGLKLVNARFNEGFPFDFQYGDVATLSDPDHITLNGVVHGINAMMVYPDSARIK